MLSPTWIESSKLWLVLDRHICAPRSLEEVTEKAVAGGVDAVVCRIKDAGTEEFRKLAQPVRKLCHELQVPFILSHHLELAIELGADAYHTGAGGLDLGKIRAAVSATMAIGYSTHSVEEAESVLAAGADYVFLGPVFATPAKLQYGPPLGLSVVPPALNLNKPVVFIGGINPATLPYLVDNGVQRVAAIAALQGVIDIHAAAFHMRTMLD